MSTSPVNEPPNFEGNGPLLPTTSYPMHDIENGTSKYQDRDADANAGHLSPSFSHESPSSRMSQAEEEGFLTGRQNPIPSSYGTAETSAAGVFHALFQWLKGPRPPRQYKIKPILSSLQNTPLNFLQNHFPGRKYKFGLLVIVFVLWAIAFLTVLSRSISGCRLPGYESIVRLSCVSRFWRSSTFCGVNASNCDPSRNTTFAFRCPADCRSTIVSSAETIGDMEYNYRSLVIGGSSNASDLSLPIYRGDSFICGAAIHAGIFRNDVGGSGVVSVAGEHNDFPAIEANGISSLNFTPSFPLSFTFLEDAPESSRQCSDPRWGLFTITLLFTIMVSISTTSPSAFFASSFISIYFCVALASDPPEFKDYMSDVSWAFRGFLPAAFVGFVIFHLCVRRTLNRLDASMEKTILWLGGCWLGALSNLTFERLPIQRLTLHDLQQPGALLTVVIITLAILFIAIFQAWAFRIEGRLPQYLIFYACAGLFLLVLATIPHMEVRIHHYILALLLLPGTTLQTRPSLLYQGLLVGLFINGVARWGFDSILQAPRELFGDDYNSSPPQISTPVVDMSMNSITFAWSTFQREYNGMSVLVNDVERFRGFEDDDDPNNSFTWTRLHEAEPEYFRFAYVKHEPLDERASVGKFTKPGTWLPDGTWIPP